MTKQRNSSTVTLLKEVELKQKVKLVINNNVIPKIWWLCSQISSEEWSGILFYKVTGDISDPANMVCTVVDIYPMDKGSSTFTSYEFGADVMKIYDQYPELIGCKYGHLHSHNSMSVYFSGTDKKELHDNVNNYQYYLSLIVNNAGNMCAKIAYAAEIETSSTRLKYNKDSFSFENTLLENDTEDVIAILDCEISVELDKFFSSRVEEIKKPKTTYNTNNYGINIGYGRNYNNDYNGYGGYNYNDDSTELPFDKPVTNSKQEGKSNITDSLFKIHKYPAYKVERFISCLIMQNTKFPTNIDKALANVSELKSYELNSLCQVMKRDDIIEYYYEEITQSDISILPIKARVLFLQCIAELDTHSKKYSHLVEKLKEVFNFYLDNIVKEA